jgi:hypothetical protein
MSKIGSFFHKIAAFFESFATSNKLGKTISGTVKLLAPMLELVIAETAGEPAAAEVKSIIDEAQSGLAAVSALATSVTPATGESSTAQIATVLTGVKTNLSALLAAGHIKNPQKVAKVTEIVGTVTDELEAMLSELQSATAAPATPAPVAG